MKKDEIKKTNARKTTNKKVVTKEINTNKVSEQAKAGFIIIMISVVILGTLLVSFYVKFDGIINEKNSGDINASSLNAEINKTLPEEYDVDMLFASMYNSTLGVLSEGIAYGNTWIEICPNSQEYINDKVYVKTCDSRFSSISDLKKYVTQYITEGFADELIGDNYLDKDGSLWILPVGKEKNEDYIELSSYTVKQTFENKIIYLVKSKYGTFGCEDNCEYSFKEHKFVIAYENGSWRVSNMEMPY